MKGVIGSPDDGAFGRESIHGPVVLVPYSFLTIVESIEESRMIYVKLVGANPNDGACFRRM